MGEEQDNCCNSINTINIIIVVTQYRDTFCGTTDNVIFNSKHDTRYQAI